MTAQGEAGPLITFELVREVTELTPPGESIISLAQLVNLKTNGFNLNVFTLGINRGLFFARMN